MVDFMLMIIKSVRKQRNIFHYRTGKKRKFPLFSVNLEMKKTRYFPIWKKTRISVIFCIMCRKKTRITLHDKNDGKKRIYIYIFSVTVNAQS